MENSTNHSVGVVIPKRKRLLDLNSLYEPSSSEEGGSKKKGSVENEEVDVESKKRKGKKEDGGNAKKRKKDDGNGAKSEWSKELHGISLALGSPFNVPKQPRGSLWRKKLECDQDDLVDPVGSFKADDSKSKDKSGSGDQLVKSLTFSEDKDSISKLRFTGKFVGSNAISKQKPVSKSTGNSSVKLKKIGADEVIDVVSSYKANATKSEKAGKNIRADETVECVEVIEIEDSESEDRVSPNDLPVTPSAGYDVAKKFDGLIKKSKQVDPKSKLNSRGSNVKLKKVRGDEAIDHNGAFEDKAVPIDQSVKSVSLSAESVASPDSDSPFIDSLDEDEDEDDDLEQNAARMLSSRFDPRCTGLSSNQKFSTSDRVSIRRMAKSSSRGGMFGSGDNNNREHKPRGADKSNGVLRKRRHFYEIPTQDMDPSWFLKRRIKVFWPLDGCYYSGHVMGYHPADKFHLVRYDDGDEELLNLEEEKFRVLLYRFEVPGNGKTRKQSMVAKDTTHGEGSIAQEDDGNANISKLSGKRSGYVQKHVKELSKSSKRRNKSQHHPNGNVNASKLSGNKELIIGNIDEKFQPFLNGNNAIYLRKTVNVLSRGTKSRETAPWPFTLVSPDMISLPMTKRDMFVYCCVEGHHKRLWSTFNMLLESKEFNIQICLPLSHPELLCGIGPLWMIHDIFMLKHGVIMTTSPAVLLEMLVIDSNHGLRSLLFEGCLMQALAVVFQILTVFSHSDGELKVPVMSIRFQLSNVHYPRKQHVFEVYCLSKLKISKWRYMETKILQKCLLIKQLSSSECTYGNIKKYEYGVMLDLCKSRAGTSLSSREDFLLTGKPENVDQFSFSFSAAFINLHLQSLVESNDTEKTKSCDKLEKVLSSDEQIDDLVLKSNSSMAPKHSSKRHRSSTISSLLGLSPVSVDSHGLSNGQRKPRTQVHYTLPFAGSDVSSKQGMSSPRSIRIRRASLKRIPDSAGNAASVKNIPIPGVHPLEEADDYGDEVPFVRNSVMYFRQAQTDAEMALDPSRILYDMDSDDEQWLMTHKSFDAKEISDELFEMAIDSFEKVSYAQHRENLTDSEIEGVAIVLGSLEATRLIYLHWQQKREKMCMPLIRHFQPPPWQRYEKQVKEWEHSVAQTKLPHPEKPPVFAFCFKPRGLDVPNKQKQSKQRSRRKHSVTGPHLASGRRSNGHDDSDFSPSTRDAKKKKRLSHMSGHGGKEGSKKLNILDLNARKALSVSENASAIARLKRDTAQRLFCKAELAIQNAVTHLMQAEALKENQLST